MATAAVPVQSVLGTNTAVPAGVDDVMVVHGVQELPSLGVRMPQKRYDAYLSRKGCNGFIYERLQNKPLKPVVYAPPVCVRTHAPAFVLADRTIKQNASWGTQDPRL